jgi:tetratricopeptide (TPR) repeat protein
MAVNKKIEFIALLLIVLFAYPAYRYFSREAADKKLAIDFTGMEPQVAQKIRQLEQQTRDNPKDAAAWGKLGMTLDVHGLNENSIECYQKAAELDPQEFRWVYYCAIALKENASEDALNWFEKGVKLKPDYVPQQTRYAKALFDAGKFNESEAHFYQALKLDPKSGEAYVGLAQISMSKNQIDKAKDFAEKAVDVNPKQSEAYNLLAIIYRRLGDSSKADNAHTKIQELPEKSAIVDPVYAALVSEGESSFWYRTRGRTYMDSGLYLMALKEFKTALQLHEDAESYDNIGAALQGLGRWDEAILNHKKAIALNPTYLKFYNLGIAYGKLGQMSEAIDAFKNSVRLNPDYSEGYYNLGVAYFKLEQWTDAIENLEIAVHKDPKHAKAHHALALSYLANGQEQLAVQEFEILRNLDPGLAQSLNIKKN